jgi:hypothetical protein
MICLHWPAAGAGEPTQGVPELTPAIAACAGFLETKVAVQIVSKRNTVNSDVCSVIFFILSNPRM